jgi:hypothetical protein
MLYVADLGRDGLLKVGISTWSRIEDRERELRRSLSAPRLKIFIKTRVPMGWGGDLTWERRLICLLQRHSSVLQIASSCERSKEVIDASPDDAHEGLRSLRLETEIEALSEAEGLDPDKEDWRFAIFVRPFYRDMEFETDDFISEHWRNAKTRQLFLEWLRKR